MANKDETYSSETRTLRKLLKMYFYAAFKWKGRKCLFHIVYSVLLIMQIIKVMFVTIQMLNFGSDRGYFSSVVKRGHITLQHLLLKNWDATRETPPYPPSIGDFAVYSIDDIEDAMNYAIIRYFHVEQVAIGYYKVQTGDSMTARLKYFDFSGFEASDKKHGIAIYDSVFPVDKGRINITKDGVTQEIYKISKDFEFQNISQPIKRLLEIVLNFTLYSVRVYEKVNQARCLKINGEIIFSDLDNNGQVNVELKTKTSSVKCINLNLSLPEWVLENTSNGVIGAVLAFSAISLLCTAATVAFAIYVFWRTKAYMNKYFQRYFHVTSDTEQDLPISEYFRFFKIWDVVVIVSDIVNIFSTSWIVFQVEDRDLVIELFDSYMVCLGVACVLAWISLLRFFKFHNKFHLLFTTLYRAFWDVLAYLVCVCVLFIGFWVCGYVVLGAYHVKFQTPSSALETLLSIVSGDEIFATFALMPEVTWVWWFSRFYIGAYIGIFTIVVINILIAIFMNAYESIRICYDEKKEDRHLGPMEKALKRYLLAERGSLRSSIYELLSNETSLTGMEKDLKRELGNFLRVSESTNDIVVLKPRTLKTFIEDEEDKSIQLDCCCSMTCAFSLFVDADKDVHE